MFGTTLNGNLYKIFSLEKIFGTNWYGMVCSNYIAITVHFWRPYVECRLFKKSYRGTKKTKNFKMTSIIVRPIENCLYIENLLKLFFLRMMYRSIHGETIEGHLHERPIYGCISVGDVENRFSFECL